MPSSLLLRSLVEGVACFYGLSQLAREDAGRAGGAADALSALDAEA